MKKIYKVIKIVLISYETFNNKVNDHFPVFRKMVGI